MRRGLDAPERPDSPHGGRLGYRPGPVQGAVVAAVLVVLLLLFTTIDLWVMLLFAAIYGLAWAALVRWRDSARG